MRVALQAAWKVAGLLLVGLNALLAVVVSTRGDGDPSYYLLWAILLVLLMIHDEVAKEGGP